MKIIGKYYPKEFSIMMDIIIISYFIKVYNMVATRHMWLLSTWRIFSE